jgi:hypothetical protein
MKKLALLLINLAVTYFSMGQGLDEMRIIAGGDFNVSIRPTTL